MIDWQISLMDIIRRALLMIAGELGRIVESAKKEKNK